MLSLYSFLIVVILLVVIPVVLVVVFGPPWDRSTPYKPG